MNDLYVCQFCGKECKNKNSLVQHEKRCKQNPNRIELNPMCKKGHKAWNKGLTKDTDIRVANNVQSIKNAYKSGKVKAWCDGLKKEKYKSLQLAAKKISKTVLNKVKNDEWHNSFGKSKLVEYKGIMFHGSWEAKFAEFLDKKNIQWERTNKKFEYLLNNDIHYYTPDFYLPKHDIYIEIKGYPTERDFHKWSQFPITEKLDIYFGDELYDMGIINEYKNVYESIPHTYRYKNFQICKSVNESCDS